ncbi:MAG: NeuD/PglB/VioB family sugar acetyltransferase [Anaerolineales bacterium]|jgi:sugar O-acyltransferase (sialic acid O-acetyltransferase NeuD family)
MTEALEIVIPLINPNEPEVQISALYIEDGQQVSEGELLCTLETTKAANELPAPSAGYIVGLRWRQGDRILSGQRLCWLAPDADWNPPERAEEIEAEADLPAGLRITQPALALARSSEIKLESLPDDRLVTETIVLDMLAATQAVESPRDDIDLSGGELIIYGGGGHGKSLIDLIRALESYTIVGIIDDGLASGEQIMGVPVLGKGPDLPTWREKGIHLAVNAVGGIGNISRRVEVFTRLIQAGFSFPTLVHPTAFIEPSAELQQGVQIFPHAYVGSEVIVGFGAIVNTAAVVSHDCTLDAYVNIAPGTLLAGGVSVAEGVLVGMGVSVNLNVRIGSRAMIGNSAVVKADVPANQIVRAGQIWPE